MCEGKRLHRRNANRPARISALLGSVVVNYQAASIRGRPRPGRGVPDPRSGAPGTGELEIDPRASSSNVFAAGLRIRPRSGPIGRITVSTPYPSRQASHLGPHQHAYLGHGTFGSHGPWVVVMPLHGVCSVMIAHRPGRVCEGKEKGKSAARFHDGQAK